jgi:hypothetical protein
MIIAALDMLAIFFILMLTILVMCKCVRLTKVAPKQTNGKISKPVNSAFTNDVSLNMTKIFIQCFESEALEQHSMNVMYTTKEIRARMYAPKRKFINQLSKFIPP